ARRYRAQVPLHGANFDEAYARARAIAAERDMVFVHPFDDVRVIAGQGALGLELVEQCPDVDAVLVPVGGGGLIAGVAVAIKSRRPAVRVIGVPSEAIAAMRAALAARRPGTVPRAATTPRRTALRPGG